MPITIFGANTDHWGLATSDLVLVDSSKNLVEKSRADALDENGDVVATTFYGNAAQTFYEAEVKYVLKSGTLAVATALKLGEIVAGKIIESIEIKTSNGSWPEISVKGKLGCQTVSAPTGFTNTYAFPAAWTLNGKKVAQLYGTASVTNGKLTGSSVSAKIDVAQQDSGLGEPIAHAVGNGTGTVSLETVKTATAGEPTIATPTTGFTQTTIDSKEPQAAYNTSSFSLGFTLSRVASA